MAKQFLVYDFNLVHYMLNTLILMLYLIMFHQKVTRYIIFHLCSLRDICMPGHNHIISNLNNSEK